MVHALDALPDPLALPWPRRTRRCLLRPVTLADADAMLAYRADPEVTCHLSHAPLSRAEVVDRLSERISGVDPTPGRFVRGVAILVGDDVVGDAMLRVQHEPAGSDGDVGNGDSADSGRGRDGEHVQLWIGYALRRDVWGQGLATEVARALVEVGREMDLPVWADAFVDNIASQAVLRNAGLRPAGETSHDGRRLIVFGPASP